jgi:malate synthase
VNTIGSLRLRAGVLDDYRDVLTPGALETISALASFDARRRALMRSRIERRARRQRDRERIDFLPAGAMIGGTGIAVRDARAGQFDGGPIPDDLQRQWIQGTGPATRPRARTAESIRNVAYALLSGADGWMFDGEDALGQVDSMSLDNQRNLKLAFERADVFMTAAERVAGEMNAWSQGFLGRTIVQTWRSQLDFTTRIFRPRGLHLDDRHVEHATGESLSASIVDLALYVGGNHARLRGEGRSVVLYLPKIQTAEEAALWNAILTGIEAHLAIPYGTIKVYVLVEQVEATFQLMEIRAALAPHFVGFNTGRWDYINSVADAMAWDSAFVNPNIADVTMTYGYMRRYEDRVRRAVNTPDANGRFALWQGGMEPNIPVGTAAGVANAMTRAVAGAEREQREGASGKWVAHWKMVHIIRPVWEKAAAANQLGRAFPPLGYTPDDADGLFALEPAARTVRGARDLISVAVQYGNAFGQGMQAAALKPADAFGNDDVLYLMEDMATGEIRLSIVWEWLHKAGAFTEDDHDTGVRAGDPLTRLLFDRLLQEEYAKLLAANGRDVHEPSKTTTLPIAREIVEVYVTSTAKLPWYIDLLNLNLDNSNLDEARSRIAAYLTAYARGERLTANQSFGDATLLTG